MAERKINKRMTVKGDVMLLRTRKKYLKELEKIVELRILDMKGKLVMTFWKGEKHE